MPELAPVHLAEYESTHLPASRLTERDLGRLRALQDHRALTVTETRHRWRIAAEATVGVLVLDRVRLVIEPKFVIEGSQLMRWLAYALAVPVPHQATARRWATDHGGYAELIASALLTCCQQLLREGLRRD